MAATFVPFFEKIVSGESLPQYQFNQSKLSKVAISPTQRSHPRLDRNDLRTKALSDLRNAVRLSLPREAVEQILGEVSRFRFPERALMNPEQVESDPEAAAEWSDQADKPSIQLQREGDKITQIIVECACGQAIALDCIY